MNPELVLNRKRRYDVCNAKVAGRPFLEEKATFL